MITVKKTGFWIFGETLVKTGDGATHAFAKDAAVNVTERGVCVTEQGLLTSKQVCFIDTPKAQSDGVIAGNAKSVAVTTSDGNTRNYESSGFAPVRVEQRGSNVVVVEQRASGARVVGTHAAKAVTSIQGNGCKVCEEINPLYGRTDTPQAPRKA